jgi:hypothetical protein
MDEMEILAQWHDSRADFWRGEAIVKLPTEAAEHTAAAATIRAAMAEIERAHKALFRAIQLAEHCDDIECVDTFSEVCHCRETFVAALAAQEKEKNDD